MITPCSSDTLVSYLGRLNCFMDWWDASPTIDRKDERLLIILSCPLRDGEGTEYQVEEVALCDLDEWYRNRYC